MSFEHGFATFRIAGDHLHPDRVTKILGLPPKLKYAKGDTYRRGPRSPEAIAKTGMWFYSTDKSNDISQVLLLLKIILSNVEELRKLIKESSSHAVLTLFWNGPAGSKLPVVPDSIIRDLSSIPVKVETDFDTDDDDLPPQAGRANIIA